MSKISDSVAGLSKTVVSQNLNEPSNMKELLEKYLTDATGKVKKAKSS